MPLMVLGSLMGQGNVFYVKPNTGNDNADGLSLASAVKTLAQALKLATANQNDIVCLVSESNTAGNTTDYQSATLDWNKDLVHLIGVGSSPNFSNRARIAQLSTATGVSPLFKLSANGCIIKNISIFHGVNDATSLVAMEVTGSRNQIEDCHIAGIGHATMVTTGAATLKLTAAQENLFKHCTIGLDTITRDNTTNGEIWCITAATRNVFEDCIIDAYISNAGYVSVTIGTNGIDRTLMFKDCLFMTKSSNKAVTQTSVFSIPAISQGAIVLKNSKVFSDGGATDWDSNNRGIIWNDAAAAAASAAGGILTNQ
jgi:hypothetical protein